RPCATIATSSTLRLSARRSSRTGCRPKSTSSPCTLMLWSRSLDGDDGHCRAAFFPTDQTEMLRTLRLHAHTIDLPSERRSEALRHFAQLWSQARGLTDQGRVHVDQTRAFRRDQIHNSLEQQEARHAHVSRVRIRKELAQISQRERAQHRLRDSVRQY